MVGRQEWCHKVLSVGTGMVNQKYLLPKNIFSTYLVPTLKDTHKGGTRAHAPQKRQKKEK